MVELENGQKCWSFVSGRYVREAVQNVVNYLKKRGEGLAAKDEMFGGHERSM